MLRAREARHERLRKQEAVESARRQADNDETKREAVLNKQASLGMHSALTSAQSIAASGPLQLGLRPTSSALRQAVSAPVLPPSVTLPSLMRSPSAAVPMSARARCCGGNSATTRRRRLGALAPTRRVRRTSSSACATRSVPTARPRASRCPSTPRSRWTAARGWSGAKALARCLAGRSRGARGVTVCERSVCAGRRYVALLRRATSLHAPSC